jgi:2-polyprenyl-3-methyl-5-hydroxy-6-metoxy-1,4-benzoquinol methylase
MRCYVCDSTDHEVFAPGQLHSTSEMRVCKACGNVMHRVDSTPEGEAKMRAYYRTEYRPAPNVANLLTTTNKLNYVRMTLDPLIDKMKMALDVKAGGAGGPEPRKLIAADIGCATGYLVNYLRRKGLRATGCELTLTYRRFAEHFYNVPIKEDLETKHRYDLLTMYHVLEHLPEPDKKLAQYVSLLADDGRFFISVPEWLDTLEEASGSEMASFDHLFHTNHINVFTAQSFKNLMAKAGLVVESEDHVQYGQTYVLRKATQADTDAGSMVVRPEDWQEVVDKLKRTKAAIEAYQKKDYKGAIAIWPKFPEAHLKLIMEVHGKDPDAQRELFEAMKPILGDNHRVMRNLGVWLYQQQMYDGAVQVLEAVLKVRPGADVWVWLGWAYREMGPQFYKQAAYAFAKAAEADPRKWADMQNSICALAVQQPTWDERATEAAKDALFKASGRIPQLIDPLMDPELAAEAKARQEAKA